MRFASKWIRTNLRSKGITVAELQAVSFGRKQHFTFGTLTGGPQQLTLVANTQLSNAAEFANHVIAMRNGEAVRLNDVARVIDSVAVTQSAAIHDGTRAVILAVQRQPDANTVQVVDKVRAMLPDLVADSGRR